MLGSCSAHDLPNSAASRIQNCTSSAALLYQVRQKRIRVLAHYDPKEAPTTEEGAASVKASQRMLAGVIPWWSLVQPHSPA